MRIIRAAAVAALFGIAVLLPASPASAAPTSATASATCSGNTVKVTVKITGGDDGQENIEAYINGTMEFQQGLNPGEKRDVNADVTPPKDVPVKVVTGYTGVGQKTVLDTTVKNPCTGPVPTPQPTGAPGTGDGSSQEHSSGTAMGVAALVLAGGIGAGLFLSRRRRRVV